MSIADEGQEPEISPAQWQELMARWKTLLSLEATLDSVRQRMEGLRTEMESSLKKTLTTEEKVHASNADVAQWNKAKGRVPFALPKVKEFIHRATWVLGAPERKKLEELFKDRTEPPVPFPHPNKVLEQLEISLKERQIMSGNGGTIYQDCKSITASIQGALRTLQSNASANAHKKRGEARARGR